MKKYLLITFLLTSLISYSQDYSSDATGDWSVDGTWVGTAPNGTLQGKIVYINATHTVTITSGGGADLKSGSELHIWGKLVIEGSFVLDASKIHVHAGGELQIIPDRDNGAVEVQFKNSSEIINDGTLSLDLGDLANLGGSSITNTGNMTIADELENAGGITNSGNMTISGPVTNSGTIDNSGTFTAPTIDNTGSIINSGVIDADVSNNGGTYTGIAPLPIELVAFKAYQSSKYVTIYWQTASEENNDYFTIERSTDGVNFNTIGIVSGAGNSSSVLDYQFTDNSPLHNTSYYRLTQTDYNGQSETFNPVSVNTIAVKDFHVWPNPADDNINISIDADFIDAELIIYNAAQKIIMTEHLSTLQETIDISNLNAGMYILSISGNGINEHKQIIVH